MEALACGRLKAGVTANQPAVDRIERAHLDLTSVESPAIVVERKFRLEMRWRARRRGLLPYAQMRPRSDYRFFIRQLCRHTDFWKARQFEEVRQ